MVLSGSPRVELAASIMPSGYLRLELSCAIFSFKENRAVSISLKFSGLDFRTVIMESVVAMPASVPSIVVSETGIPQRGSSGFRL